MVNTFLLSIIIPVYNVEKYIMKCVSSIIKQINELKENDIVEIIIVNDGTPDNSINIITDYIRQYDFVKVISQENKGLSAARNFGLSNASGKYVWFFDSDDWLNNGSLEPIVLYLKKGLDLCVIGKISIDEEKNILDTYLFHKKHKALELIRDNQFMTQLYIVRRQILQDNDLHFYESIYHEDVEFTPRMLCHINKYCIIDKPIYCYLKRIGSITMGNGLTYNPKRAKDTFLIVKSLDCFRKQLTFSDRKEFSRIISLLMNNVLQDIPNMEKSTIELVRKLFKNNKTYFCHLLKSLNLKYMLEWILFSMFPSNVIEIFSFLKFRKINRKNENTSRTRG